MWAMVTENIWDNTFMYYWEGINPHNDGYSMLHKRVLQPDIRYDTGRNMCS